MKVSTGDHAIKPSKQMFTCVHKLFEFLIYDY